MGMKMHGMVVRMEHNRRIVRNTKERNTVQVLCNLRERLTNNRQNWRASFRPDLQGQTCEIWKFGLLTL